MKTICSFLNVFYFIKITILILYLKHFIINIKIFHIINNILLFIINFFILYQQNL